MADRRLIRAVPIIVVLLIAAIGLGWIATGHWRRGAAVLAAAAAVGAVLRLLVPDGSVGPLAVRSRTFDVIFLGGLATLFTVATTIGL